MLVTLGKRGAALARIELNSFRYLDLEDRSGYLGHLVMDDDLVGTGCPVQVVGTGTPAFKAGVKPGDRIVSLGGQEVRSTFSLESLLAKTLPGQTVELVVLRGGEQEPVGRIDPPAAGSRAARGQEAVSGVQQLPVLRRRAPGRRLPLVAPDHAGADRRRQDPRGRRPPTSTSKRNSVRSCRASRSARPTGRSWTSRPRRGSCSARRWPRRASRSPRPTRWIRRLRAPRSRTEPPAITWAFRWP